MFERILAAVDASQPAAQALAVAIELATALHARLGVVHVAAVRLAHPPNADADPHALQEALRQDGASLLRGVVAQAPAGMEVATFLREGVPVDQILAVANEWAAQLVVAGTHGHPHLAHLLHVGTTELLLRRSPCPVLVVRAAGTPKAAS